MKPFYRCTNPSFLGPLPGPPHYDDDGADNSDYDSDFEPNCECFLCHPPLFDMPDALFDGLVTHCINPKCCLPLPPNHIHLHHHQKVDGLEFSCCLYCHNCWTRVAKSTRAEPYGFCRLCCSVVNLRSPDCAQTPVLGVGVVGSKHV